MRQPLNHPRCTSEINIPIRQKLSVEPNQDPRFLDRIYETVRCVMHGSHEYHSSGDLRWTDDLKFLQGWGPR